MTYELWDRSSRNLLGEFSSSAAALDLVREIIQDEGVEQASYLVLSVESGSGKADRIAAGLELIELAKHDIRKFVS